MGVEGRVELALLVGYCQIWASGFVVTGATLAGQGQVQYPCGGG